MSVPNTVTELTMISGMPASRPYLYLRSKHFIIAIFVTCILRPRRSCWRRSTKKNVLVEKTKNLLFGEKVYLVEEFIVEDKKRFTEELVGLPGTSLGVNIGAKMDKNTLCLNISI